MRTLIPTLSTTNTTTTTSTTTPARDSESKPSVDIIRNHMKIIQDVIDDMKLTPSQIYNKNEW